MVSVREFVQRLSDSQLLSAAEAEALSVSAVPTDDARPLVNDLVRQGKLTRFQANAVWQGRHSELVLGPYTLLDVIGQGGMGTVYRALDRERQRTVAIKILSPEAMKARDAVDRFRREAEVVGKLRHRNLVSGFDAGQLDGKQYLAMEYCDGIDLDRQVAQHGPLAAPVAAACILQAARGLEYTHEHGVLHRDVKPANLFLVNVKGQPVVKLLDLGLAWIHDASATNASDPSGRLTQSDRIMGTVTYMAPEQALEIHTADQRADIYSLGCTWYYLVAGRPIYEADSVLKRLVAHRESPIPELPGANKPLAAVYRQMVAKKPEERYQSMTEVIAALEACGITDATAADALDRTKKRSAPVIEVEPEPEPPPRERLATLPSSPRKKGKGKGRAAKQNNRPLLIAGGIGAALLVAILLAIALWPRTPSTQPVTTVDPAVTPPIIAAEVTPVVAANDDPPPAPPVIPAGPPPDVTGEYRGEITGEPWGLQVRKRDDGTFAVRVLKGGLPGDGWDGQTAYDLTAAVNDEGRIALEKNPRVAGAFDAEQLTGTSALGDPFVAKRIDRHSPTLDKPPPAEGILLFNGQNADHWTDGVVTADGHLAAGTATRAAFQDSTLHLEFRLPNSATPAECQVLLQGRYAIRLADSFGQPPTSQSSGSLLGGNPPTVDVSLPPGAWQTLDVAFAAPKFDSSGVKIAHARGTVRLNGVIVHDNIEWTAAVGSERPDPGPLVLGTKPDPNIVFRNVWLHEARAAGLMAANRKDWPALPDALQTRVRSAYGHVHDEFAFVQTLPFDDFAKLAEGMLEAGYRPVRVRPFPVGNNVQTAALWHRDGHEWQLTTGSVSETQSQAERLLAEGLWPEDIAGYLTRRGEVYVTLWGRLPQKPAEEARVYPGVRHLALRSTFSNLPDSGFAERIDQVFTPARGQVLHSTLWWKSSTRTEGWYGDQAYYESHAKGFQIDLCITRGPLSGAPAYSWCSLVEKPAGVESLELHGLSPEAHLAKCVQLVEEGYRPVVLGTAQVTGNPTMQTCSLWHRRTP